MLQDEVLKAYIDSVFNKYDTDKNGSLDVHEMTQFFNDLFHNLKINVTITEQQSLAAIQSIDTDGNGTIDRQQLFTAFKMMLNPYLHHHSDNATALQSKTILATMDITMDQATTTPETNITQDTIKATTKAMVIRLKTIHPKIIRPTQDI